MQEIPSPYIVYEIEAEEEKECKSVIWIKEDDLFRPSKKVSLYNKLDPGLYTAGFNRDIGYFCKKVDTHSDELINFKESKVTGLLEEIKLFWDKKDIYKENKLMHKRGVLLTGYPGTGKSSIISILIDNIVSIGGVAFMIDGPRNMPDYIDFITHDFRDIQPETPIITIIEDFDKYVNGQIESDILDFLDGKMNINHHIVIATSNNTSDIPSSFLRPSRFDLVVEIELPSDEVKREYLENKNISSDKIDEIILKTPLFSLADLKELYICVFLLGYTVDESVEKIKAAKKKKDYTGDYSGDSEIEI